MFRNIPKEWKITTIEQVAMIKGGKRMPKGKRLLEEKTPHPYIKVKNMHGSKYINIDNDFEFVSEKDFEKISNYTVKTGDIVLSIVGTIGVISIVGETLDCANLTENCVKLIDISDVSTDYLYYYLISELGQHEIKKGIVGSTQPKLPIYNIKQIKVPTPPLSEQSKITDILSALDNKIENNNAIIANLEEQAQAIFKSSFIDFEPLSNEEYKVIKLGELFNFVKGKKPKNTSEILEEGYVPYLVKNYIDNNEGTFASNKDGVLIDDLDIFMLMDGANSGNIYYGYSGILGSTFSWLKNDNKMVNEYIYWYLLINQESIKKQNTGSAIPHANKDYINNLEVNLPSDINNNSVLSILRKVRLYSINLRRENNKLAEIRDTLLPKLMSGEIRVGNVGLEISN